MSAYCRSSKKVDLGGIPGRLGGFSVMSYHIISYHIDISYHIISYLTFFYEYIIYLIRAFSKVIPTSSCSFTQDVNDWRVDNVCGGFFIGSRSRRIFCCVEETRSSIFSLREAFAIDLVLNFVWDSGRLRLPAFMLAFSTSIRIDSLMYSWVRYL